ncbi:MULTISPECIES: hypothetical protein [Sphingobacterium]|uniref:hypothetical protein n=1 Tax=Sphingobacterium TaxID=28453 RepID=UPI000E853E8D|nr:MULTISPECIES: hypothetical protein [Sphingobacterium]QQT60308.1 hypothetical protein I6I97_13770 [Sphingobacterium multivorum]HBI86349.1 hypothetical protein [Sphingobacterium sp.]
MVKFILVDIVPEYHSRDPLFSTFGGTRHIPLYEVLDIFDNKEDALKELDEINSAPGKQPRVLEKPIHSDRRKAKLYICNWDVEKYENAKGAYFYTVSFNKDKEGIVRNYIDREQSNFENPYKIKIRNRQLIITVVAKSKEEALNKANEAFFDFIFTFGNNLLSWLEK